MPTRKDNLHIAELKSYFQNSSSFTTEEVKKFYESIQFEINPNTLKTRLYRLINKGIIKREAKGLFSLGNQSNFIPIFDNKLKSIYKKLKTQFPLIKFCIWNTKIFNHLMLHQPGIFFTIVEVETDNEQRLLYARSVFNFISTQYKFVYLNPKQETFDLYTSASRDAIIVIPLVSEAPLQKIDKIPTITIEKLLVDLFCEEILFTAQQGAERATIFTNAFDTYTVNRSKLFRYATRRNKKKQITEFLKELNIY